MKLKTFEYHDQYNTPLEEIQKSCAEICEELEYEEGYMPGTTYKITDIRTEDKLKIYTVDVFGELDESRWEE